MVFTCQCDLISALGNLYFKYELIGINPKVFNIKEIDLFDIIQNKKKEIPMSKILYFPIHKYLFLLKFIIFLFIKLKKILQTIKTTTTTKIHKNLNIF